MISFQTLTHYRNDPVVPVTEREVMTKLWIGFAGFFGFTAVALGALGAHVFGHSLSQADLARYDIAVHYQMWHATILCAVAWLEAKWQKHLGIAVTVAGWSFVLGIILFSGALISLSLLKVTFFAHLAPVGGLMLMTGWLALIVCAFRIP